MSTQIAIIIVRVLQFYSWMIFAYAILSWFPSDGLLYDVYKVLSTLVEPYLWVFRRIIPPMRNVDLSPLVGFFVLQLLIMLVARLAGP
ncbi:MAG: YggT family protein [Actinobacteria bacterium]|nr:MAG: YggT family protein [Actinomycetota bacterium]